MDRKKVCRILKIIGLILIISCTVGDIIIINFCGAAPTKFSQSTWCLNVILWVGVWAVTDHRADYYKDSYERLTKAYDKLSNQFDKLIKASDEIDKSSIEQNRLCEDIIKDNKEILAGWKKSCDDIKQLCKEKHDLIVALAEYEPNHPLIIQFLEEAKKYKAQKENEQDKVISE